MIETRPVMTDDYEYQEMLTMIQELRNDVDYLRDRVKDLEDKLDRHTDSIR